MAASAPARQLSAIAVAATAAAPPAENPEPASSQAARPLARALGIVRDWLRFLEANWEPPVDTATATLMIAVVRGLLLDRIATGDRERTDDGFRRFTELV